MSRDYIRWASLTESEQDALQIKVLDHLMDHPAVREHFELSKVKRNDYRGKPYFVIKLKSLDEKSTVWAEVTEEKKDWNKKAVLHLNKQDGYGNGRTRCIRYVIKADGSFNQAKAAAKILELNEESITYQEREVMSRLQDKHKRELARLMKAELDKKLRSTDWEIETHWKGVSVKPDASTGLRYPTMIVQTYSSGAPDCSTHFELTDNEDTNSKMLSFLSDLINAVTNVIEGKAYRELFAKKPIAP
jgi:hypothetical protein